MLTRTSPMWVTVLLAVSVTNLALAAKPKYTTLKDNYSSDPPAGFKAAMKRDYGEDNPNSCAIRLAFALEAVDGHFFDDFTSDAIYKNKPIRARELADYLINRIAGGISISKGGAGRKAIDRQKGIIYFANIRPRPGQTGVSWHISLWDGSSVVDGGDYFDRAGSVQFWRLD